MKSVAILDIQCGNIHSVNHALKTIGVDARIINRRDELKNADAIILPGIGHFDQAIKQLTELKLLSPLKQHIDSGKHFLGICLGMQVLANSSEEGELVGLEIFNQQISELKNQEFTTFKVPHSGWNTLNIVKDCALLKGISVSDEFFFLHKYCWKGDSDEVFAVTNYGQNFASVVGRENCWGVQFHPEKSHQAGLRILENFISL